MRALAVLAAVHLLLLPGCAGLLPPEGCGRERTLRVDDASPFPGAGYRREGNGSSARFIQTWQVQEASACSNQDLAVSAFINFDDTSYQTCSKALVGTLVVSASSGAATNLSLASKDKPDSPWHRLLASAQIDLAAGLDEPTAVSYVARLEASLPTSGDLATDQICMRELLQNVQLKATHRVAK